MNTMFSLHSFKKYGVELLGAFVLSVLVGFSLSRGIPVSTPVMAALILMFFVYTIGGISGAHINPAVTIGLISLKKISIAEGSLYVAAQLIGGLLAWWMKVEWFGSAFRVGAFVMNAHVFWGEVCGAFLFGFGIAAVVYGAVEKQMNGVVIGASLLVGILCASLLGSRGILNPAVVIGTQTFHWVYFIAPIIGVVAGMQVYAFLQRK
jgi:aquaporin Z